MSKCVTPTIPLFSFPLAAAAAGRLRIFFVVRQSAERCANERRETSEHTHTQVYKEGRKERKSIEHILLGAQFDQNSFFAPHLPSSETGRRHLRRELMRGPPRNVQVPGNREEVLRDRFRYLTPRRRRGSSIEEHLLTYI